MIHEKRKIIQFDLLTLFVIVTMICIAMPVFYSAQVEVLLSAALASSFVLFLCIRADVILKSGIVTVGAGVLGAIAFNQGNQNLIISAIAGGTIAGVIWVFVIPYLLSSVEEDHHREMRKQCVNLGRKLLLVGCGISGVFAIVILILANGDVNIIPILIIGVLIGVILGLPYLLVAFLIRDQRDEGDQEIEQNDIIE